MGVYGGVTFCNPPREKLLALTALWFSAAAIPALAENATNALVGAANPPPATGEQPWNWHFQNTDIVQGYPGFSAKYGGANSLPAGGQMRETVSVDLMAGVRLWRGAEIHADGLMWQGFGINNTRGSDGFPNGEAFRVGTETPDVNLTRFFIRQDIGFGGEQETVEDDPLHLAGKREVSRLTFTFGRFGVKDIFDNNAYANDPRSQFMNWGLMANEAWDYPADSLGFTSGFAVELNQPSWTLRSGIFQMPRESNGMGPDWHLLDAWGMVTEFERRYTLAGHAGAARLLGYLNRAHMGSYQDAIDNFNQGGSIDVTQTRADRQKYGFGLNLEQEVAKNVGAFLRAGWSDGQNEAWCFSDVDYTASLGLSVKGESWHRREDTFGVAGLFNGLSPVHREYFADGGVGVLAGDGRMTYGVEKILETYYDCQIWKTLHIALDYQFIADPAFNQDRGPVSVFAARVHWEF